MSDKTGQAKVESRRLRQRRARAKIHGTAGRPRMNVYRSLTNIFVQLIDDENGHTLVSASTIDNEIAPQVQGKTKIEAATIVGKVVAERAKTAGIETVVFDRGGFKYHGRIAALADGAREGGLKF